MVQNEDDKVPGTVRPARITRACCGFRYEEDELKQEIDFSAAVRFRKGEEKPAEEEEVPEGKKC